MITIPIQRYLHAIHIEWCLTYSLRFSGTQGHHCRLRGSRTEYLQPSLVVSISLCMASRAGPSGSSTYCTCGGHLGDAILCDAPRLRQPCWSWVCTGVRMRVSTGGTLGELLCSNKDKTHALLSSSIDCDDNRLSVTFACA